MTLQNFINPATSRAIVPQLLSSSILAVMLGKGLADLMDTNIAFRGQLSAIAAHLNVPIVDEDGELGRLQFVRHGSSGGGTVEFFTCDVGGRAQQRIQVLSTDPGNIEELGRLLTRLGVRNNDISAWEGRGGRQLADLKSLMQQASPELELGFGDPPSAFKPEDDTTG